MKFRFAMKTNSVHINFHCMWNDEISKFTIKQTEEMWTEENQHLKYSTKN